MSDYIMNRESLKRHCEAMCHKFKDVPTSGTYGEHRLVLDLLEQTEWIPVSEKLPEERKNVIVTDIETSDTYQSQYFGNGYWECDNGYFRNRIVAWMPLPEPYEPQESEDRG